MIKFFRHIRRNLMETGKTVRYFKYAIGEIILVVIGILIALQINNSNEAKSNEARFISVLKEIKTDLESDILATVAPLQFGKINDSLMRRVLDGELGIDDYKNENNDRLFYLGLYHDPFEYLKTGFHKFESFQGLVPEKYATLAGQITRHYTKACENFDTAHAISQEISMNRQNYLIQNYAWYHLIEKKERPDDMIAFYLENPTYKNWIYQSYNYNTFGKGQSLDQLRTSAATLLVLLSANLDLDINTKYFKNLFGEPLNARDKNLEGTYKGVDNDREFSLRTDSGYLIYKTNEIDGFLKKLEDDKYQSNEYPNWNYEVVRNEKGQVTEFVMTDTGNNKTYRCKKVTND